MSAFLHQILHKRHLVVFMALILLAAGVVAYQHLPLEAYPDVANMQVRVITQVPGKAAEEVEKLVTIPIEKELNGIPHSDPPRSISIFGLSVVTVVFDDEVDPYVARQQVLERLANADVPDNVKPALDPNASPVGEVFRYTVEGKRLWSSMDRKEAQDWILNRKFKSVPGIVDSTGFGGPTKIFQVELDPGRLRATGLTQSQVADAISSSNGSTGGSYIVRNDQNYMVRGMGLLRSVSDIENVVVSSSDTGIPIRVSDVAKVSIGAAIRKGQVGKNDDDDVVEGILLMRRGENPSDAVANISERWDEISKSLPPGMHMEPLYDRTALVKRTINTISHNVAEGIVLVIVLLMLFLFQVRSALICAVVIPLALLFAFVMLTLFKVPANLLSLGAIDFGIIVDGAVVMVENIVRHLSHLSESDRYGHVEVLHTILKAAQEVAKPILFSTAIIVMTFLPILSFERVEGKLFRPLAITMNFNLIGAVFITMTVVPVLCLFIFGRKLPSDKESPITTFLEKLYRPILKFSINHRIVISLIALGSLLSSLALTPFLGSEFLPELEEGNIWLRVTILPTSVSLDKAVQVAGEIRRTIKEYPEVINVVSQVGSPDDGTDPNTYSTIEVLVDLKLQDEWRKQFKTKEELVDSMESDLNRKMPGFLYNFSQYIKDNMDEAIGGVKGEFGIKIFGSDLQVLTDLGTQIRKIVSAVPGMVDVANDQLLGQPQLMVAIDRERAARYGINSNQILDVVETSVGGRNVTEMIDGEKRFGLVLRFQKNYRDKPEELQNILVATPSGQRIPLGQLAQITEAHGATAILRDRNERRIAVKANIRGRDLGSAVIEAQKQIRDQVKIPEGYRLEFSGQFDRAQEAMARLAVVVPVTLGLIFLLLYGAFGSATIAALVMVTVPLAATGGIIALFLTGTHFSISAGVGFIALFGVAIQNGVILVSKIRETCGDDATDVSSLMSACVIRMRPVMIATLVALAGLVPAAISTGIGSQSQKPFAIVIVGGILPATLLTLVVLPALYSWFAQGCKFNFKFLRRDNSRDYIVPPELGLDEVVQSTIDDGY
ncbi:MAG: efflux RND transporter permease subunit [Candidatus Melainabacteria bacterium]|nr:MAG: efflux RND transporter permease subunit [Candidatus Melainabacteria bacterium]